MSPHACRFVWYELMTTDVPAAEAFYSQVVGWQARDAGMPDMRYTLLERDGTAIGGVMALPPEACAAGARPGWLGYVAVDDVDTQAARVAQAGGAVQFGPQDIPGVGRFATVSDPQGAVLVLFKGNSAEQPPQPAAGTPGTFGWHELHAAESAAAFDFYAGQFGWTQDEAMDMGPMGVYRIFAIGGVRSGGMMTRMLDTVPPAWLYYVNVEAIDAAVARVGAHGGQVIHGPQQVPGGGWIAQCLDPQGGLFAMVAAAR